MPPISDLTAPLALLRPNENTALPKFAEGVDQQGGSFAALLSQSLNRTSVGGLRTDSRHMPLAGAGDPDDDFQNRALDIFSRRQQVIASNIANADTPNYKAVDVDMQDAMHTALTPSVPPLPLAGTSSSHLAGNAQRMTQALALKYQVPVQGSVDGNTVDMDFERTKFAENTVKFQFSLNQVQGDYKEMAQLLANLKG